MKYLLDISRKQDMKFFAYTVVFGKIILTNLNNLNSLEERFNKLHKSGASLTTSVENIINLR